jgi:long-chain acyl-CoA synthetase
MQKPWLRSYPEGTPAEISAPTHPSIAALFESTCQSYPDNPAFTNMGTTLTYRQLEEKTAAFANFLRRDLGLKKGDRVAIMMPNLLQDPVAIFGVLRAGLVVVNTNPLYTAPELKHQLNDSGASAIVVVENFAHVLETIVDEVDLKAVITTQMGDLLDFPKSLVVNLAVKYIKKLVPAWSISSAIPFKEALQRGENFTFEPTDTTVDDIAFLQYTGGTTGVAKGAMLTHANLLANMEQCFLWITHGTAGHDMKSLELGKETVITALPLYHIFALTANCLTFMKLGGHNYLITNPRDMPSFINELKETKFTAITGVNTLFNGLTNTPGFDEIDFSNLKVSLGGGMAVQESVAAIWKEKTGCTLVEAYGLTEASPAVCINPLSLDAFNHSIGLPMPSTECSIQDEDGNLLPIDTEGELCIKGPQVMKGYWQRDDETTKIFDADGWLHTGDVAKMDKDGFFYIVDRLKDMILVSGFNVYPNEIEAVIAAHPDVLECGVIGVPDKKSGEAVLAVVVKKEPHLSEQDIKDWCEKSLVGYKTPDQVYFDDELPKTNVGKILRRTLRDQYVEKLEQK